MPVGVTQGWWTRSIIIPASDQVILSAVQVDALTQRFVGGDAA